MILSGQIFVQDHAELYVSDNIALQFGNGFNKDSETHKKSTTVYIAKGTTVTNLQKISNAEIAYLPKQTTDGKTFVAKKATNKKEKTKVEEKYQSKITISTQQESKIFLEKLKNSIVTTTHPSQDYKVVPPSTKKIQFLIAVLSQQKIQTAYLNKKFNTNIESINSIRPPPCVQTKFA